MKYKVIITGVTGMVGEGVLHECLQSPDIETVLTIGRRPSGKQHPKLKEIIHADFTDVNSIADQLKGYDGCFCCMGVTSVGKDEATYFRMTYDMTMPLAKAFAAANPGGIITYVSGLGTDSTEKGKIMWARVKGKTENDLMKLPVKGAYMFRPGIMTPTPGLTNTIKAYKWFGWIIPIMKLLRPNTVSTLAQVGQAMLVLLKTSPPTQILEVKDIVKIATKQ